MYKKLDVKLHKTMYRNKYISRVKSIGELIAALSRPNGTLVG